MFYYKNRLSHSLFLFHLPAFLGAQGIQFEHITFAEGLAKAKAENKLIFVDAFTTWCGPCKMLTSKTFPDSAVGTFREPENRYGKR